MSCNLQSSVSRTTLARDRAVRMRIWPHVCTDPTLNSVERPFVGVIRLPAKGSVSIGYMLATEVTKTNWSITVSVVSLVQWPCHSSNSVSGYVSSTPRLHESTH
jgi:hypothetical protein